MCFSTLYNKRRRSCAASFDVQLSSSMPSFLCHMTPIHPLEFMRRMAVQGQGCAGPLRCLSFQRRLTTILIADPW